MAANNYGRERNRYGFDGGLDPSLLEDWTKTHMSSVPQATATAPSQQSNIANTVPEIIPNPGTGKLGTEPGGKSNAIDVSQKALTQGNIPLEKPWYGKLPNTEGGPPVKPMNMAADLNWTNRLAGNQQRNAMQSSRELGLEDPAAFQKRMQKQKLIHNKMLEGVNPALEKPTRPDTSHLSYQDEFEGQYNRFANEGKGGWGSSGSATPAGEDILEDVALDADWDTKMMDQLGEGLMPEAGVLQKTKDSVLQKGKDLLGKGGDLLNKYAGPATMVMQGINSIREYGQRNKVIGSLEDSVSDLEGSIGNMANEKDATLDALSDTFSEERRKIGEERKLVLGAKLDDARQRKTGGLISGSKQELMDDITDTLQTTTDLDLARAEEGHDAQESKYIEDQRNKRADATRQLEQLTAQLEQQKKEQKWAPVEGIVDLAISGVSLANPAAGLALGMAKSGAKSMIT